MMKRWIMLGVFACYLLGAGTARAQTTTPQTFSAFKTTLYYRFKCDRNIYKLPIGAQAQSSTDGETTLYWEIWDSGKTTTDEMENVSNLNTLPVQSVTSTPQPDGFPGQSRIFSIYRPCTGQSLYVWAASSATKIGQDEVIVHFSDAAERPLSPP